MIKGRGCEIFETIFAVAARENRQTRPFVVTCCANLRVFPFEFVYRRSAKCRECSHPHTHSNDNIRRRVSRSSIGGRSCGSRRAVTDVSTREENRAVGKLEVSFPPFARKKRVKFQTNDTCNRSRPRDRVYATISAQSPSPSGRTSAANSTVLNYTRNFTRLFHSPFH